MALISQFDPVTKTNNKVHNPVRCGYCRVTGDDTKPYLLLETYGSARRKIAGKVSQSIQLDEKAAAELVGIIRETFPSIL